jgi:hypothetical protein
VSTTPSRGGTGSGFVSHGSPRRCNRTSGHES